MNRLLFLPVLFSVIPVGVQEPDIQCPGGTTVEMRFCASQSLRESKQALKEQLPQSTLEKWKAATQEVCGVAYAPYKQQYLPTGGFGMRRPTQPISIGSTKGFGER